MSDQQKGYGADPGKVIDLLAFKNGELSKQLAIAECVIEDLSAQLEMRNIVDAQSSGT